MYMEQSEACSSPLIIYTSIEYILYIQMYKLVLPMDIQRLIQPLHIMEGPANRCYQPGIR